MFHSVLLGLMARSIRTQRYLKKRPSFGSSEKPFLRLPIHRRSLAFWKMPWVAIGCLVSTFKSVNQATSREPPDLEANQAISGKGWSAFNLGFLNRSGQEEMESSHGLGDSRTFKSVLRLSFGSQITNIGSALKKCLVFEHSALEKTKWRWFLVWSTILMLKEWHSRRCCQKEIASPDEIVFLYNFCASIEHWHGWRGSHGFKGTSLLAVVFDDHAWQENLEHHLSGWVDLRRHLQPVVE